MGTLNNVLVFLSQKFSEQENDFELSKSEELSIQFRCKLDENDTEGEINLFLNLIKYNLELQNLVLFCFANLSAEADNRYRLALIQNISMVQYITQGCLN